MIHKYGEILKTLIDLGKDFDSRRWVPATSGNFSVKLEENLICITASGVHKGYLKEEDFVIIDLDGRLIEGTKRSSAETLLHLSIYKLFPNVRSVLHVHSINSTLISVIKRENILRLQGYELLKGFRGIMTHDVCIDVPIFENSQDMMELSEKIKNYFEKLKNSYGFLIRKHGIYTWGESITEAAMNLEIFDFIFECEIKLKILGGLKL